MHVHACRVQGNESMLKVEVARISEKDRIDTKERIA
jgi:hypothetical protein